MCRRTERSTSPRPSGGTDGPPRRTGVRTGRTGELGRHGHRGSSFPPPTPRTSSRLGWSDRRYNCRRLTGDEPTSVREGISKQFSEDPFPSPPNPKQKILFYLYNITVPNSDREKLVPSPSLERFREPGKRRLEGGSRRDTDCVPCVPCTSWSSRWRRPA